MKSGIKSVLNILFILFLSSNAIFAQNNWGTFSLEAGHITRNSNNWYNTSGFRVGYTHDISKNYSLNIDLGSLNYMRGDLDGEGSSSLVWKALDRSLISYHILGISAQAKIVNLAKTSIGFQAGVALRFTKEVFHNYAERDFNGQEQNTNEILTTTFYRKSKDLGLVFGLYYLIPIRDKFKIQLFLNVENYGDSFGSVSEQSTYSLITNGAKLMIEI